MFSLWTLVKACALVLNALTILHKDRFLRTLGLHEMDTSLSMTAPKNQAVGLLQAVQYMKVPLIALNSLIIVVEVLFGGRWWKLRSFDPRVALGIPSKYIRSIRITIFLSHHLFDLWCPFGLYFWFHFEVYMRDEMLHYKLHHLMSRRSHQLWVAKPIANFGWGSSVAWNIINFMHTLKIYALVFISFGCIFNRKSAKATERNTRRSTPRITANDSH